MYDVIIVGGGPGGLTAALYLGRACRKVLLIDNDRPRNAASHGVHGFISRDGTLPAELRQISRDQLKQYTNVEIKMATATAAAKIEDGFEITLEDGAKFQSRKLILATGLKDSISETEGFSRFWANGVFLCPFCDGWEVRDQPLVVHAKGDDAMHLARLLTSWSGQVTVCTDGPSGLTEAQLDQLVAAHIPVIEDKIVRLEGDTKLQAVAFANGNKINCRGLFTRSNQTQPNQMAVDLGCALTAKNNVQTNEFGQTNVPGLYAIGDAKNPFQQVVMAAASGAGAAGMIVSEFVTEAFAKLA